MRRPSLHVPPPCAKTYFKLQCKTFVVAPFIKNKNIDSYCVLKKVNSLYKVSISMNHLCNLSGYMNTKQVLKDKIVLIKKGSFEG